MTTKRETILVALHVAVGSLAGAEVSRNLPLVDFDADNFANLSDGANQQTEAFLNPPLYEFTMTPTVVLAVKHDDPATRDANLDAMIAALVAATTAALVDGLGDLVTDIRPQPADYAPDAIWGASDMKAAEVAIELDYWSTSSLG